MKRTPANDTHCRQSYRTEQFVEYFYTFGIDSNTAFSEYINFAKPFEENDRIKPKLINQFPLYPKPNSYIEPSVLMKHCFPNGFIPIETVLCPKEEVFHFSLDNLLHHDEYPKLYFTVLSIPQTSINRRVSDRGLYKSQIVVSFHVCPYPIESLE